MRRVVLVFLVIAVYMCAIAQSYPYVPEIVNVSLGSEPLMCKVSISTYSPVHGYVATLYNKLFCGRVSGSVEVMVLEEDINAIELRPYVVFLNDSKRIGMTFVLFIGENDVVTMDFRAPENHVITINVSGLPDGVLVYDVIYNPSNTNYPKFHIYDIREFYIMNSGKPNFPSPVNFSFPTVIDVNGTEYILEDLSVSGDSISVVDEGLVSVNYTSGGRSSIVLTYSTKTESQQTQESSSEEGEEGQDYTMYIYGSIATVVAFALGLFIRKKIGFNVKNIENDWVEPI